MSSPTLSWEPIIMYPPNHMMPTMELYMANWRAGRLSTARRKVPALVSISVPLAELNFSSSYSPRTKAFTARMAVRFSCTTALSLSTARCKTE